MSPDLETQSSSSAHSPSALGCLTPVFQFDPCWWPCSDTKLMETKMELINDFLWVEDKPQDNSKFINDQPTAGIVYLNNQLLGLMPLNFIV